MEAIAFETMVEVDPVVSERTRGLRCARTGGQGEATLSMEGALDALSARELRSVFDTIVADSPRRVTIDLAKVTLLDSSGAGAIVSLFKRMKARGGRLVVAGAREQPLAVLRLLKLDRVLCE